MNRENIYFLPEGAPSTFSKDETLDSLPLPKLEETLERYYHSLKPFATEEELRNTKEVIAKFKDGIGSKLHKLLEERAKTERNWVEKWWEDYAYLTLRTPLLPYCMMAQPLIIASVGVEESEQYRLKALARCMYFSVVFWKLIREERLRPPTNPDGSITFSSNLYRNLCNSVRIPGEEKDILKSYFKTAAEGDCPSHAIIIGKGRIFYMESLNKDGSIPTPQQYLHSLRCVRDTLDNEERLMGIPILTCDERDTWAKNRKHLIEISPNNAKVLELIESSAMVISFDEYEPIDYSEACQRTIDGDYHSRWCDKSSSFVAFKNGKLGCLGEHSLYDGTISVSYSFFILLSLMEEPEPDWDEIPTEISFPKELKFDIDQKLHDEIIRMDNYCEDQRNSVLVRCEQFNGFGKEFMKSQKVHPDSFIQTVLLWSYYKLHGHYPPTYETATMRVYYHGRTETVRSCSVESVTWIEAMKKTNVTNAEKAKLFKAAADAQNRLMSEARKGKGIDRHLFGLWCTAYENKMEIPEFYDDPLYKKSGGGGNFYLSTSTLGYTINVGFVAPMVLDGYGVFYSMLNDCVWMIMTAYRGSEVTSVDRFYKSFTESMLEIKNILENSSEAKL
jgi:carnitine O-octanoyltransferase